MNLLEGIKIIDFTRLLPGPMATNLLAEMGAEIIKIESPKRMDYVRLSGTQVDGVSILFHQLNHNKDIKIIDYSTREGMDEIMELVKDADAIIEQFRPGAMDAWGLGYEALKKYNPNIVYVSLTGHGQNNEYAMEAGHDFNYLAYSGLMSLMKDDNGKPSVSDTQFADISGAYMAVMALQSALIYKFRTNKGCYLDVSITDAMNPYITIPFALHKGGMDYRQFNIINGRTTVNYAVYRCKDGKWISVAAMEPKFWNNICETVGKPDWKRNSEIELMLHSFPKHEVETLFKTRTRDEWIALFKGKDVCIAPILEIEELEDSAYHTSKGTFKTFKTADGTTLKKIGIPFKLKK